jgi:hypothetical protein
LGGTSLRSIAARGIQQGKEEMGWTLTPCPAQGSPGAAIGLPPSVCLSSVRLSESRSQAASAPRSGTAKGRGLASLAGIGARDRDPKARDKVRGAARVEPSGSSQVSWAGRARGWGGIPEPPRAVVGIPCNQCIPNPKFFGSSNSQACILIKEPTGGHSRRHGVS